MLTEVGASPTYTFPPMRQSPHKVIQPEWSDSILRGLLEPRRVGPLPGSWSSEREEREYLFSSLPVMLVLRFCSPRDWDQLIRPETFEMANLMALGCTFSLAVPVLASLYRGLNWIAHVAKPSYSRSFFACHYLYRWLAHYF